MASDQQVTSKLVLAAIMEFRRQGADQAIEHLEAVEPDLAEYVLEELTAVHRQVLNLGGPPCRARMIYRRVQSLVLVSLASLRKAHYELWRDAGLDGRLGQLDRTSEPEGDEPPPNEPPD